MKQNFTHLHVHTHMSVQDALPSPEELAIHARKMGFGAIAITDHGRMGGCVEFVDACRKPIDDLPTIKPILGYEAYTCENMEIKQQIVNEDGKKTRPKHPHLTLLAMNENGYKNLLKASSIANEIGYYYVPRIDWSVIESYSEDVICLSGCIGSELSTAILLEDMEGAEAIARKYKDLFGDRYYIEMQYHGMEQQKSILPKLKYIANKLDIKMVASNDVHYLEPQDWEVHDVLIQMRDLSSQKKERIKNGKRDAYATREFYLKSEEAMRHIFEKFCPGAIENTMEIADRVEDYLKLDIPHLLPSSNIPKQNVEFNSWWKKVLPYNKENDAYLAFLAFKGLKKLGYHKSPKYVDRLKSELQQIWYMGVTDYFLIQREMVEYLKSNDIMYGIRGSGVGSLANYCLEISTADPIRWNLLFERFLNPGRGTQYKIDFVDSSSKNWLKEHSSDDQTEATARIREIFSEKRSTEEYAPFMPDMEKELWVLENQSLSNYIIYLADSGFKAEKNECQLWSAYFLGITDEKPTSGLIVSKVATLPDVDTDIDDSRRQEVIEWARNRFGNDQVALIGTRGTYQARAAVTNSLKVSLRFNKEWGDQVAAKATEISKTIPIRTMPPMTIQEAKEESPDFAGWANKYDYEINIADKLIGKIAHTGVHAAGVLISSKPICESTPIERAKDALASAYDMQAVERVGLVKYDYLGVAAYQMVSRALKLIEKRYGKKIDIVHMDLDDKEVFKLYAKGNTASLFQCGGKGMQNALQEVEVDCLEDLIAVLALYRPGPMEFIPDFARGKQNPKKIKYAHPLIEKHLAVTYGIMVYQEQAMFLARELGNLSWIEVDKLRKAISKKKGKEFEESCNLLKARAIERDIKEDVIDEILHLMEKFGEYAFNRSHACAYAILSYWTGWLRTYYPAEWMAACIHVDKDDEDKLAIYKKECALTRIKVIAPNVNDSGFETTVTNTGAIALPLNSIKGVGELAKSIVANQPFESLQDLCDRARPNRGMVSSLAGGGALDCFDETKRFNTVEELMQHYDMLVVERKKKDKQAEKERKQKFKTISPMLINKNNNEDVNEDVNINKKPSKKTIPPFDIGMSPSDFS